MMTSWRRKLPRINVDTRLEKELSGSYNVLNNWLRRLCAWYTWISDSLCGNIRAWRQLSKTKKQFCGRMKRRLWLQSSSKSCCNNFELLHYWLHYAKKCTKSTRAKPHCGTKLEGSPKQMNQEIETVDLNPWVHSREEPLRVCKKTLCPQGTNSIFLQHFRNLCFSDWITRQDNVCYTCYESVFLDNSWHWEKHEKRTWKWTWITLTKLCKNCSSTWWWKGKARKLNSNKSFKQWVWKRVSETSQGREFKSRLAVRRWKYHVWSVCNVWMSKKNWDRDLQSVL